MRTAYDARVQPAKPCAPCVWTTNHVIEIELESPLCHGLLDTLAVRRVASRAGASLALVDEATDLIGRSSRILFAGAESVHSTALMMTLTLMLLLLLSATSRLRVRGW